MSPLYLFAISIASFPLVAYNILIFFSLRLFDAVLYLKKTIFTINLLYVFEGL